MKLGFLLATAQDEDLALLVRLVRAALARGHEVMLFLMHRGVEQANRRELASLVELGIEAVICSTNLAVEAPEIQSPLSSGSQLDHAAMIRLCDRWVSFA